MNSEVCHISENIVEDEIRQNFKQYSKPYKHFLNKGKNSLRTVLRFLDNC